MSYGYLGKGERDMNAVREALMSLAENMGIRATAKTSVSRLKSRIIRRAREKDVEDREEMIAGMTEEQLATLDTLLKFDDKKPKEDDDNVPEDDNEPEEEEPKEAPKAKKSAKKKGETAFEAFKGLFAKAGVKHGRVKLIETLTSTHTVKVCSIENYIALAKRAGKMGNLFGFVLVETTRKDGAKILERV